VIMALVSGNNYLNEVINELLLLLSGVGNVELWRNDL
jgi:hypothetical protein